MLHITNHDVGCQYQVTVTQRWNEKQIKASERAKEFANSKDVHLEVDDYLFKFKLIPTKYFDFKEQLLQDFDICYGSKELILNADFTLEQGRRWVLPEEKNSQSF